MKKRKFKNNYCCHCHCCCCCCCRKTESDLCCDDHKSECCEKGEQKLKAEKCCEE